MKRIVIDSRVIKHLGKDLITTPDVALVELIKNAIDAKAKNIHLKIYNNIKPQELRNITVMLNIHSEYSTKPLLLIEDDGIGMTDQVIENGFLKIATDIKVNEKGVLGQKGIGRLAAQRLGAALLVETASSHEEHTSYVFIDWDAVINGIDEIPGFEAEATSPHTRLWIFGIDIEDYIDNAIQFQQMSIDESCEKIPVQINRELKSALNYLISPFEQNDKAPVIDFSFDNRKVDIAFPSGMITLAESTHQFWFEDSSETLLHCRLSIQPWFIERVHRALVKPEAFNRLRKRHIYYAELLQKNHTRLENVLSESLSKDDLHKFFYQILSDVYAIDDSADNKEILGRFVWDKADDMLSELNKISPVKGLIYSFKQGAAIGENIILDAAYELKYTDKRYSRDELRHFLEDYNGIKLYRDIYRIGFLGNKESDWIKLQQFRTKGQQWYRFDLGNTVGYVSLTDDSQEKIQEISSRLDISENKTSEAFKMLINVVFNYLFYSINRKANDIIKVLLSEEGLLGENLKERVKKSDADLKEMMRRNARMQQALHNISQHMDQGQRMTDSDQVVLPEKSFRVVKETIKALEDDAIADAAAQKQTFDLISEADAQLKAIEVESYNNYKLMANGLITETITHELHSLSKTGLSPETEVHFDFLKDYFVGSNSVPIYNRHVVPIHNTYTNVSSKLKQVSDFYSFLETTFIKKGSIDVFVDQNILSVITEMSDNLKNTINKNNVRIVCKTENMSWFVPKGVLLHVFYNLINNSLYWIDVRRKRAQSDPTYRINCEDEITIDKYGMNGIVVKDTGTGVSSNMEDILFEPLQSGKPFSEGRGMGLYIVKKLLESFGGGIKLLEERNQYGNRYKFLLTNNKVEDL